MKKTKYKITYTNIKTGEVALVESRVSAQRAFRVLKDSNNPDKTWMFVQYQGWIKQTEVTIEKELK